MLKAMHRPIAAASSNVVKVRVLTNRSTAGLTSPRGVALATGLLRRLGWNAGD